MKARTAFSPKNGSRGGEHDAPETSTCSRNSKESKPIRDKKTRRVASKTRRTLKCRRLSQLSRKAALLRKTRRKKKQGNTIAKRSQRREHSVSQEVVNREGLPVCDKIEADDSDLIPLGETCGRSSLKTDGGFENVSSSSFACSGKESVAEDITTVIILAEVLWLLEGICICSPHLIFTATAVTLKISDDNLGSTLMEWPLNEINSIGSYACQQAGYTLLELGLTDSGAEALQNMLEEMPHFNEYDLLNCKGCCITAKIYDFDWPDQERQIMSLSAAYESLWMPVEINAGQVLGSSFMGTNQHWTLVNKESFAEEVTEVIISADDLLLLESVRVGSSQFQFTANTISLNISDSYSDCTIIKWPLNDINSIASYMCQQEGCVLLELGLTDSGVEALKRMLEETHLHVKDDFSNCPCNCLMAKISDVDWPEQRSQIISLSESYNSLWKPLKLEIFAEQGLETLQGLHSSMVPKTLYREDFVREDLIDSGEEEGSNDQAEEGRHEDTLHGWFDIVYPKEDHDAVTLTKNDFLLLNPEEFISDTIIDFYIKYLQSTLSEKDKRQFYFFNSFFFRKLTEVDKNLLYGCDKWKSTFERVKRWTTKINIFEKDYLFIPIMESAHWSLIIICNPGYISSGCEETITSNAPLILHFDSLEGCHNGVEEPIRNYLREAWMYGKACKCECKCKSFSEVKFISAQVPQQTNYSDCGLFLLHYVELFIREVQAGNLTQFVTCEWFDPIEASNKRLEIQNLILQLRAEELEERGVVSGCLDFQDSLAFSRNSGGVSAKSALLLQEVAAVGNRDQASVSIDFEGMSMFHNNPVEQMGGAIYSSPLNCTNQMCMDIFNRHDDSMVGVDLYSTLSLDALAPSCEFPHNGSYKQLFMLCHSGAKFSLDYAREEDFSVSEPLSSNPVSENPNPNSISIGMNGNTESGNVCIVSNPYYTDVHNRENVTQRLSIVDLEGTSQMAMREVCRRNTVDGRINQLPVTCNQLGLTMDSGMENMESFRSNIEKDTKNCGSFLAAELEDSHTSVFQESASKDNRPPSISSTIKLASIVCSKETQSKDESITNRNQEEEESLNNKDAYGVTSSEDIIPIHKDLCALQQEHTSYKSPDRVHDKDLNVIQDELRLENTLCKSSDVGQSTPDHQAKPGLEVENMLEVVKVECTSKEDKPTSASSQQNLSTVVCSNKSESADEICANRNHREDEYVHNCEVISFKDIASILKDSCIVKEEHKHYESPDRAHDEDLPIVQNILNLDCTHHVQSHAGQCTANHEEQPEFEVENVFEIAKISKPNCRKKLLDSEILDIAGRRPITRSATRRIEDKPGSTSLAQQGRKRKSLTEAQ